jgi:hypothetical protein
MIERLPQKLQKYLLCLLDGFLDPDLFHQSHVLGPVHASPVLCHVLLLLAKDMPSGSVQAVHTQNTSFQRNPLLAVHNFHHRRHKVPIFFVQCLV